MSRTFNGTTDLINCTSDAALDNQEPFTVMAWIFPTSMGEGSSGIVASKDGGGAGNWMFRFNSGGTNGLRFNKDYDTTDIDVTTADNVVTLSAWNHVACSWDGSATATNVHIYVNGVETGYVDQVNGVTTKNSDAALAFLIGNGVATTRTFAGTISDVTFVSKVLTAGQIGAIMRLTGGMWPKVTGYWPLRGAATEPEYSGNANSGTLTGTTIATTWPPSLGITSLWRMACAHY